MNNLNIGEEEENFINLILEKGLEEIKNSQSNYNNKFTCTLTSSLNNINNNNSSFRNANQNKLISSTNPLTPNISLHNSNTFNNKILNSNTSTALHKIITNIQQNSSIEHNLEKLNEENEELSISKSSVTTKLILIQIIHLIIAII